MSKTLAESITNRYFDESKEVREDSIDFLDAKTKDYLEKNGFVLQESTDPHVRRYFGSFLTTDARQLMENKFKTHFNPLVWINCNENSDFQCPRTYKVEIGVEEDRDSPIRTFGVFGSSSVFCATIEAAMLEATMSFLYNYCEKKGPSIVCWRRRVQ